MSGDDIVVAFRLALSIVFVVFVVVSIGAIWIAGVAFGLLVVLILAVGAAGFGLSVGSNPESIQSASFAFLYLRTLARELLVALRRMVRPVFFTLMGWYLFSLVGFLSVTAARSERIRESDFSGLSAWMADTDRVALVIFLSIALYQMRHVISSVVTLLTGLDGKNETAIALGAREPTRDELDNIISSLKAIQERIGKDAIVPNHWMVLDGPMANHYVIGRTVYLTSALIEGDYKTVGMLHALGHFQHGDGAVLLALRRLIAPLPYYYGIDRRVMPPGVVSGGRMGEMSRASDIELADRVKAVSYIEEFTKEYGGVGLLVYGLHWASFWRERVFLADKFVRQCGYTHELIEYLEAFEFFDVAQPFLQRGRPYTRERIDRLELGDGLIEEPEVYGNEDTEEEGYECPECSEKLTGNETECPSCGVELLYDIEPGDAQTSNTESGG